MKGWDYSILTKTANLHGGPEKYIRTLQKQAYQEAIKATDKKWFGRTLVLCPFAIIGVIATIQHGATKIKSCLDKNTSSEETDSHGANATR